MNTEIDEETISDALRFRWLLRNVKFNPTAAPGLLYITIPCTKRTLEGVRKYIDSKRLAEDFIK